MNLFYFNKFFIFFIVITSLQFAGPVYNFISFGLAIPLTSYVNILSQPLEIKFIIKKIATLGVLNLLIIFSSMYLYIIFYSSEKMKSFVWGAFFFIGLGGLGYYCSDQKKLEFRESNQRFLNVNADKKNVVACVKFKEFPKGFYQDLVAAKKGEVKLLINQRLCAAWSDMSQGKIILNNRVIPMAVPMELDKAEIVNFLETKSLHLVVCGEDVFLDLRDLKGKPLASRDDLLLVDDKNIELGYDKAFFLSFYVESLDGKILRVYL